MKRDPLIFGGGPSVLNSRASGPAFFDAILLGRREALVGMCEVRESFRKRRVSRQEILQRLSEDSGVYVPSLYQVCTTILQHAGAIRFEEMRKRGV